MNKIILDRDSIIEINVDKDSTCNLNNYEELTELNINLCDGVTFILNEYSEVIKRDYKINIINNNNTTFIYNHSFKVSDLYNLNINVNMVGNSSKNIINIHGINDVGKSNIVVDGSVDSNTFDNILDEKIRILNINEGMSNVYPNMYIDTKNIIANHSVSISDISKEYLFYMNSKGIDNILAKELIINGFLDNEAR